MVGTRTERGPVVLRGDDPRADKREVYFIEAEGLGMIKIGVSNCPRTRVKALAKMSPVPLRILATFPTDRLARLEKDLHSRFAAHRAHGEWFRACPEIMDYVNGQTPIPKAVAMIVMGRKMKAGG